MRSRSPFRFPNILKRARQAVGWLAPGLGVKRWIFVVLVGTSLVSLGITILLLDAYFTAPRT
jgi:hypothetical protein